MIVILEKELTVCHDSDLDIRCTDYGSVHILHAIYRAALSDACREGSGEVATDVTEECYSSGNTSVIQVMGDGGRYIRLSRGGLELAFNVITLVCRTFANYEK